MPAKWFRKNEEAEVDGALMREGGRGAWRRKRRMDMKEEEALTRGGGRGGGR